MLAASGREALLADALADWPQPLSVWRDRTVLLSCRTPVDKSRFRFIEFWIDDISRKTAGPALPKGIMNKIAAGVDGPIVATTWDVL